MLLSNNSSLYRTNVSVSPLFSQEVLAAPARTVHPPPKEEGAGKCMCVAVPFPPHPTSLSSSLARKLIPGAGHCWEPLGVAVSWELKAYRRARVPGNGACRTSSR